MRKIVKTVNKYNENQSTVHWKLNLVNSVEKQSRKEFWVLKSILYAGRASNNTTFNFPMNISIGHIWVNKRRI